MKIFSNIIFGLTVGLFLYAYLIQDTHMMIFMAVPIIVSYISDLKKDK